MKQKTCSTCLKVKPVTEFPVRRDKRKDGTVVYRIRGQCKGCVDIRMQRWLTANKDSMRVYYRDYGFQYRAKYPERFKRYREAGRFNNAILNSVHESKKHGHMACTASKEEIRAAFSGRCEICGISEHNCSTKLHMDHCHTTGRFRGWLCRKCNTLLAKANDDCDILSSAIEYCRRSQRKLCKTA